MYNAWMVQNPVPELCVYFELASVQAYRHGKSVASILTQRAVDRYINRYGIVAAKRPLQKLEGKDNG